MKEKFIKSTILLVIGGLLTKILGMVIRIITTRIIGIESLSLYMFIMPSFNLFITIATLSFPTAVSKVIAEEDKNCKKVVITTVVFALLFNFLIMILIWILAPFISTNLLNNKDLYYPIMMTSYTLPFITISSILRGYFFGKERMFPHVLSNFFEQIIRIILTIFLIPKILVFGVINTICFLVLFNIASEVSSIIILLLFMPHKVKIKKEDFSSFDSLKSITSIAIPTTIGRLITGIGLFLEPAIITFVLTFMGFDNAYITGEYGIISGYVLPMVTMPSFLTGAISSSLLPIISKYYKANKLIFIRNKIKQAIMLSLSLGLGATVIMFFFPNLCLKLIFNTNYGVFYLKVAAIMFFISYIGGILNAILQGTNNSRTVMLSSLIGMILKTVSLFALSFLDMGMLPLLISYFIYFAYTTIHQIIVIKRKTNCF